MKAFLLLLMFSLMRGMMCFAWCRGNETFKDIADTGAVVWGLQVRDLWFSIIVVKTCTGR